MKYLIWENFKKQKFGNIFWCNKSNRKLNIPDSLQISEVWMILQNEVYVMSKHK